MSDKESYYVIPITGLNDGQKAAIEASITVWNIPTVAGAVIAPSMSFYEQFVDVMLGADAVEVDDWEQLYNEDVERNEGAFSSRDKEDYMLEEIAALRARLAWLAQQAPQQPAQPAPRLFPGNVSGLPSSTNYTPAQALNVALNHSSELEQVLIIGQYFPDKDGLQERFIQPSRMSILTAVWLHRRLGLYIDENA